MLIATGERLLAIKRTQIWKIFIVFCLYCWQSLHSRRGKAISSIFIHRMWA